MNRYYAIREHAIQSNNRTNETIMRLAGKSVVISVDCVPSETLSNLITFLVNSLARLVLYTPLELSKLICKLEKEGNIGVIRRKAELHELQSHLCICAGSREHREEVEIECTMKCIWKYIVDGKSDINMDDSLIAPILEAQRSGICFSEPQKILPTKTSTICETPILYLVGAGPGAANLLTLQAYDLIKSARVIISDRLVSPEVIALIPSSTKVLFARKVAI